MTKIIRIDVYRQSLGFEYNPNLTINDLIKEVSNKIGLRINAYFGLMKYDDEFNPTWLLPTDCKISKFAAIFNKEEILKLKFRQLYYPESFFSIVSDHVAVLLFYLDAKEGLIQGRLRTETSCDSIMLAALNLQIESGDSSKQFCLEGNEFSNPFVSYMLADACSKNSAKCVESLNEKYKSLSGLCKGAAAFRFLRMVKNSIASYGFHFYNTKSYNGAINRSSSVDEEDENFPISDTTSVIISIGYPGIGIYDPKLNVFKQSFDWLKIQNIFCNSRRFSVRVVSRSRADYSRSVQSRQYNWLASSASTAFYLWQNAIHQHKFYLNQSNISEKHSSSVKEILLINESISFSQAFLIPEEDRGCVYEKALENILSAKRAILTRMEQFIKMQIMQLNRVGNDFVHPVQAELELTRLEVDCLERATEISKLWLVKHKDDVDETEQSCPTLTVHHYLLPSRFNLYIKLSEQLARALKQFQMLNKTQRWSWSSYSSELRRTPSYRSALSFGQKSPRSSLLDEPSFGEQTSNGSSAVVVNVEQTTLV